MSERRIDTGIWDKPTIAALLAVAVWYLPLIKQNERMRSEVLRLQEELATKEETARQIKVQIEALRNDPETVERYAREKLGLARAGETVIRFEQPNSNAP